jgi:hypothetical protein
LGRRSAGTAGRDSPARPADFVPLAPASWRASRPRRHERDWAEPSRCFRGRRRFGGSQVRQPVSALSPASITFIVTCHPSCGITTRCLVPFVSRLACKFLPRRYTASAFDRLGCRAC